MSEFIQVFRAALEPVFCEELIARFESDPTVYTGRTGLGLEKDRKCSFDLDLTGPGWRDVVLQLRASLVKHIGVYMEMCPAFESVRCLDYDGFRLRKYPEGGHFDWHSDTFDYSTCARVLAAVWYLNTPEVGGETQFKFQSKSVTPVRGRLALFPTSFQYIHRSAPTVNCSKYIVVSFLTHKIPSSPEDQEGS